LAEIALLGCVAEMTGAVAGRHEEPPVMLDQAGGACPLSHRAVLAEIGVGRFHAVARQPAAVRDARRDPSGALVAAADARPGTGARIVEAYDIGVRQRTGVQHAVEGLQAVDLRRTRRLPQAAG